MPRYAADGAFCYPSRFQRAIATPKEAAICFGPAGQIAIVTNVSEPPAVRVESGLLAADSRILGRKVVNVRAARASDLRSAGNPETAEWMNSDCVTFERTKGGRVEVNVATGKWRQEPPRAVFGMAVPDSEPVQRVDWRGTQRLAFPNGTRVAMSADAGAYIRLLTLNGNELRADSNVSLPENQGVRLLDWRVDDRYFVAAISYPEAMTTNDLVLWRKVFVPLVIDSELGRAYQVSDNDLTVTCPRIFRYVPSEAEPEGAS